MLIGADRLFSLINVDEIEKALPSSPKANGEGHGRFESLLYNSSAPQDGLMAMASKEGRLKLPSFAAPVGEEGGTLVASKAESDVDDSPNPEGEIDLKVEDIASSQLDDLLSSLLGPLAHGDLDAERDQVITPPGDEPLTDVVTDLEKPSLPVIPLDRPVSEVAPKAESESLSAPAKPTEIPDTPVKPETGRNTVPEQDVVAKVEVASPAKPEGIKATADPKVQVDQAAALDVEVASPAKPEGIQATAEPKVQVGQAATPDVEVVSPAKPEGTPTVPGQRAQIEPTRPEGAQPDLPSSDGTIKADTVKPELPTSVMTDLEKPSLPVIPLDRPVSEVAPKAEPESPLAPAQREEIPDTPVKPETGRNTVPEQDVVAKVKVTSPAKPEGIQATAEPKVQIGQAATPDVELASPAKPEGIQATAEPKAQIGQVATPDVELASSAKPEGTPTVPGQRAQVEPTRPEATQLDLPSSDATIKADTVKPGPPASVMTDLEKPSPPVIPLDRPVSEVAPKAESESPLAPAQREEIPDTPVKPETGRNTVPEQDVVAKVEVTSPAKPEGIKATADPKVQVDQAAAPDVEVVSPAKPEGIQATADPKVQVDQAAALDVEVASPAKPEVVPTVPEQRAQVEPTRPEATQLDLPSSDATIKADTVKPEPPASVMTDLEKPSPRGSSGPGSMVQKDQPRSEPSVHMTQVATLVAQESAAHTVKIVAPRTVQSRGYLISPETTSSNVEEGRIDAQSWSKGKEIPMFLSSWTPEKREEKFQPVTERSENKPEASFQRAVDQGLENLVAQTDTRQSIQPKSEPVPTQTMYLPQKGPDALPHGLVQVVRHVMADGTQKATVIIDPPALGRVEVEVRATSTGIEASFKVDSAQVRDMIKPQIPLLQDMLSQQGIVASSISVDIRQGDERRSPWRDSLDSIKLRRRKGASEEEELEIPSMDTARLDMERGVLQWYA